MKGVIIKRFMGLRNIATIPYLCTMSKDMTYTYQQAKALYNTAELKRDYYITVDNKNAATLRKHLSEMIKRKASPIRFTSRIIKPDKLLVIRIK